MKFALIVLSVFLFFGCNKESESSSSPPAPRTPQSPNKSPEGSAQSDQHVDLNFENFGIIREFGGSDRALLFGVYSDSGIFNVTRVLGPEFLKTFQVGVLKESSMAKLFSKGLKPMSESEKKELFQHFGGYSVIYSEDYEENFCSSDEIKFEIVAIGTLNAVNIEITFQFVALPNPNGNCHFQIFGTQARYIN